MLRFSTAAAAAYNIKAADNCISKMPTQPYIIMWVCCSYRGICRRDTLRRWLEYKLQYRIANEGTLFSAINQNVNTLYWYYMIITAAIKILISFSWLLYSHSGYAAENIDIQQSTERYVTFWWVVFVLLVFFNNHCIGILTWTHVIIVF